MTMALNHNFPFLKLIHVSSNSNWCNTCTKTEKVIATAVDTASCYLIPLCSFYDIFFPIIQSMWNRSICPVVILGDGRLLHYWEMPTRWRCGGRAKTFTWHHRVPTLTVQGLLKLQYELFTDDFILIDYISVWEVTQILQVVPQPAEAFGVDTYYLV